MDQTGRTEPTGPIAAGPDRGTSSRSEPGAVGRLAGGSAIALALAVIVYLALVMTEPGQTLENLALRGSELRSEGVRAASLERLSQVNLLVFAIALVTLVVIGGLRGRLREGILVAGLMGTSVVVVELGKEVLPRPELVEGPDWLLRNSFPSGTTAAATAIVVGAILTAPDRVRWLVVPIGAIYAAIVAEAVQTTGWHRLSDTVGAVLLVLAISAAGAAVMARVGFIRRSRQARVDRRISLGLIAGAAAAAALAAMVLGVAAMFPLLTSPPGGRRVFLQTAFPLLTIGVVISAVVAFTWLFEPFSLGRPTRPAGPADTEGSPAEDGPEV